MLHAAPDLRGHRFSNMLNFEGASDEVFLTARPQSAAQIDTQLAHTGKSSLRVAGGESAGVRLSPLLGGRAFPGDWTLAGAYFYAQQDARLSLACTVNGQVIARSEMMIPAQQWSPVMVDLVNRTDTAAIPSGAAIELQFQASVPVWCDDVVLVDNTLWLVGEPGRPGQWSVLRRGMRVICKADHKFEIRLDSADVKAGGWKLEEASVFRARFSSTGEHQSLTIYPDGRSYWDGKFNPLASDLRSEPLWARQQDSPAEVQVTETMGRLDRSSPGDANNDGYNEARGTYMLIANGPRLTAKILPRSVPALRPILEVKGLPPGEVLATVEGMLVEKTHRLQDGTLLAEIPAKIERPATVTIRVQ